MTYIAHPPSSERVRSGSGTKWPNVWRNKSDLCLELQYSNCDWRWFT